ncbi:MAG: nucleoside hydrolase [Kiritimatiellae bacterium]|nr:nucleoside hydrolase [Kiritimatiellia bacterium]
MKTKPLYLQTDIGGDVDDFWALAMILKQPWLDLKMILTDTGNTIYRSAICAKLLQMAGRESTVVGAGIAEWPLGRHGMSHLDWVADYPLASYPNYTQNGIEKFVEMVRAEPEPVTLVAIGPVPSLAAALRMAPDIARKIDFAGMFGSLHLGYGGKPVPDPEYNVYLDVEASKTVFSADWHSAAITPLDTCGFVKLDKALYGEILACGDWLTKTVVEVFEIWRRLYDDGPKPPKLPPAEESSVLYDTVAVHMATTHEFLEMEEIPLVVDDKGFTRPDPSGRPFMVATAWKDLPGYERFLVDTLTGKAPQKP